MQFNYPQICSNLLKDLPGRTKDVILRRYGLKTSQRETLESIGKSYGITRERVRQIEEDGFSKLQATQHSPGELPKIFRYFNDQIRTAGDLKKEDRLLTLLGGEKFQNQALFLLTLGEPFKRFSENRDFYSLWTIRKESVTLAQKIIDLTLNKFEIEKKSFGASELFKIHKNEFSEILNKTLNKNIFYSYLEISKRIQLGPEGLFGLKDWPEINPRGVKDKAYLVFKKEKRPLHFKEVAARIEGPCLSQTVHNELIKDPRFILVGRGLYALREWGYEGGQVKDIISKVLREAEKPLFKEEILEKVLKQRLVKENTILLNLSNKKYFLRDPQGKYTIKEV